MLTEQCDRCEHLVPVLLLTLLAAGSAGFAHGAGCDEGPYRAFDFWVGDWEVSAADGRTAGRNVITREQEGCVLVERWQGTGGSTGMSMNFYDPVDEVWRQVWMSPESQIDISGGVTNGSMVLEGTIVYLKDSRRRPFRGTWTPLDDTRVRQFFEERDDHGEWVPWFEGFYSRPDGSEAPP